MHNLKEGQAVLNAHLHSYDSVHCIRACPQYIGALPGTDPFSSLDNVVRIRGGGKPMYDFFRFFFLSPSALQHSVRFITGRASLLRLTFTRLTVLAVQDVQ